MDGHTGQASQPEPTSEALLSAPSVDHSTMALQSPSDIPVSDQVHLQALQFQAQQSAAASGSDPLQSQGPCQASASQPGVPTGMHTATGPILQAPPINPALVHSAPASLSAPEERPSQQSVPLASRGTAVLGQEARPPGGALQNTSGPAVAGVSVLEGHAGAPPVLGQLNASVPLGVGAHESPKAPLEPAPPRATAGQQSTPQQSSQQPGTAGTQSTPQQFSEAPPILPLTVSAQLPPNGSIPEHQAGRGLPASPLAKSTPLGSPRFGQPQSSISRGPGLPTQLPGSLAPSLYQSPGVISQPTGVATPPERPAAQQNQVPGQIRAIAPPLEVSQALPAASQAPTISQVPTTAQIATPLQAPSMLTQAPLPQTPRAVQGLGRGGPIQGGIGQGPSLQPGRPPVPPGVGRGGASALVQGPRPVQRTNSNAQMMPRPVITPQMHRASSSPQLSPLARPPGHLAASTSGLPSTPTGSAPRPQVGVPSYLQQQSAPPVQSPHSLGRPASAPIPGQQARPLGGTRYGEPRAHAALVERKNLQELIRQVDPEERLETDVEEELLNLADDFIESVTTFACALARHRRSSSEPDRKGDVTLEAKDILLHLERNWHMSIPGFSGDELRPYRRIPPVEGHKQRVSLVRRSQHTVNSHEMPSARTGTASPSAPNAASTQSGSHVGGSGALQKSKAGAGQGNGPTKAAASGDHVSFKLQSGPPQKVQKTTHAFLGT